MTDGRYIEAIEKRLAWLRWSYSYAAGRFWMSSKYDRDVILGIHRSILEHGETYYMSPEFCELVEHASSSVPPEMRFEESWMQSRSAFMVLGKPLEVATKDGLNVMVAVGWQPAPLGDGALSVSDGSTERLETPNPPGSSQVIFYVDLGRFIDETGARNVENPALENELRKGFSEGAALLLRPGEPLSENMRHSVHFSKRKNYLGIVNRWLYAAFHLMSKRLAVTVRQQPSRAVRRRAARSGEIAPPFVNVVTLRRLEHDRMREAPNSVEWHWRWTVRGHWRNQWFPREAVHKPEFIEAYIKGPAHAPLKPPGIKLFAAVR